MVLARVSLSYHDRDPASIDQNALWKEIQARTVDIPFIDGTARQASFPHIGQAGYASAYYTYMWSLVIGKDLFSKFEGRDLTAARRRAEVSRDDLPAWQLEDGHRRRHRVPRPSVQFGRVGEMAECAVTTRASTLAPPAAHPPPPSSA